MVPDASASSLMIKIPPCATPDRAANQTRLARGPEASCSNCKRQDSAAPSRASDDCSREAGLVPIVPSMHSSQHAAQHAACAAVSALAGSCLPTALCAEAWTCVANTSTVITAPRQPCLLDAQNIVCCRQATCTAAGLTLGTRARDCH